MKAAIGLNLLRYPRRSAPGRLLPHVLVGALIGSACIWLDQRWQTEKWGALQLRHAELQSALRVQADRQRAASGQQLQHRSVMRMAERERQWQSRREQLASVQQVLQIQASAHGLWLQRWQVDGRQLVLHLWLPGVQPLSELTAAMTRAGPSAWAVQSLTAHASGGVEAVIEATWPVNPSGGGKAGTP